MAAGAGLVACGDDAGGDGSPPESFYAGLEDSLLEEGLSPALATCFVDAVRAVGPTTDDVSYFEENEDFPAALADELDARTSACLEPAEGDE